MMAVCFVLTHVLTDEPSSLTVHPHLRPTTQSTAENKVVVNWLRNKSGIKTKVGVLGGKRVDYFKGESVN